MKVIKKIIKNIYDYIEITKVFLKCKFFKNKIFLLGVPIHGNLGDQAIAFGEVCFLKENFSKYKLIEIESGTISRHSQFLKKMIGNSIILIHGGGFLGTLWLTEEEMFRKVLTIFKDNTVIVLPQTIFFDEDENGKKMLEESKKIYSSHPNLYICCREDYSYKFMKDNFSDCNILLIPDMVLYLNSVADNQDKQNVLFCIRNDHEKVNHSFNEVIDEIHSRGLQIDYTDTVIKKKIFKFSREKYVCNKIREFSKYKLVVTDRLHGMVFTFLSKTPCLVYENKSYKVKGVYKWLSKFDYIKLYNKDNIHDDLNHLFNNKFTYGNNADLTEYQLLINVIKDNLE